jgi:hypothetical protein
VRRNLVASLLAASLSVSAHAETPAQERPALLVRQGTYFRYALPPGWQATETTNGVEMAAPDRVTGASFSLLMGGFGEATPESFLQMVVQGTPVYVNPHIERMRPLPDQPGFMGFVWKVGETELTYEYLGVPCRAHATVAVMQGMGQYAAMIRAYQAPARSFARDRYWLPATAETVVITNPQQVAGIDRIELPKGTPHDYIYGEFNRGWQERGLPNDRISRNQQEGTMGYERMIDPETGQLYDMPLEKYDASRGGYRNPNRPDEILERAPVGW